MKIKKRKKVKQRIHFTAIVATIIIQTIPMQTNGHTMHMVRVPEQEDHLEQTMEITEGLDHKAIASLKTGGAIPIGEAVQPPSHPKDGQPPTHQTNTVALDNAVNAFPSITLKTDVRNSRATLFSSLMKSVQRPPSSRKHWDVWW